MANDDPTSLRMGFGYHQARAAGLGGIRSDRSPRQVNRIINERKDENEAIRDLREAQKDAEWKPFILHRIGEGRTAPEIANELGWMQRYAWARKVGYSLAYRLKHHWRD